MNLVFVCSFKRIICFIIYLFFIKTLFLAVCCGLQDLSSPAWAVVMKVPNPNHWTIREFPRIMGFGTRVCKLWFPAPNLACSLFL